MWTKPCFGPYTLAELNLWPYDMENYADKTWFYSI